MSELTPARRPGRLLFFAAWIAYAFFHQGGGFVPNASFAMVRSIVEQGRSSVDSYIFYSGRDELDLRRVLRTPVVDAGFNHRGMNFSLSWSDRSQEPIAPRLGRVNVAPLTQLGSTSELVFANGRFYPREAPGSAWVGVPAYFIIYSVERLLGVDPDLWPVLTLNAWLTNVFGVALVAAGGVLAFFHVGLLFWGARTEVVWATVAFAFATLYFPYSTMSYPHAIVAAGLVAALLGTLRSLGSESTAARNWALFAGAAAGLAAISTYAAIVPALMLATFAALRGHKPVRVLWFALGLLVPMVLLAVYHQAAFGKILTTPGAFPNALAPGGDVWVDFSRPTLIRLGGLLFSPFRGLFVCSPVLLMGLVGWVLFWRSGKRAEAALAGLMALFWLGYNLSLTNWHGSWGVGPRHMIPALPFLALPLVPAFSRLFKTTLVLLVPSLVFAGLATAVDPQSPVGINEMARLEGRAVMFRWPFYEYTLPIFLTGSAYPILEPQIEGLLVQMEQNARGSGASEEQIQEGLTHRRAYLEHHFKLGDSELPLGRYSGPVSANPRGMYGHWELFEPGSAPIWWNSFNLGELLLPRSRWSLLALLIVCLPLIATAFDRMRAASASASRAGPAGNATP